MPPLCESYCNKTFEYKNIGHYLFILEVNIDHWAEKSCVILDSTLKWGGQVESTEYSQVTIYKQLPMSTHRSTL